MSVESIPWSAIHAAVAKAIEEDLPTVDVTTEALIPESVDVRGRLIAQENMTVAGLIVAKAAFWAIDSSLRISSAYHEGSVVGAQSSLLSIQGNARSILMGERIALNFLQHLSGIATLASQFRQAVAGYPTQILDTRKTLPGLRVLQKWAVHIGGGMNHRFSLGDGMLIKDNHLRVLRARGIGPDKACQLARRFGGRHFRIAVEVENLKELNTALKGQPDVVLLDNMSPEMVRKAVHLIRGKALVEVSGGITLENAREMAAAGADFVSIGALTHSVKAMDISLTLAIPARSRVRRGKNG